DSLGKRRFSCRRRGKGSKGEGRLHCPRRGRAMAKKERDRMQGLAGVKVLELGHMASAAYAVKLMADLGAEVIKVEEPEGDHARRRGPFPGGVVDPEKSGLFLYLNTNKRGITLDLRQELDKLSRL